MQWSRVRSPDDQLWKYYEFDDRGVVQREVELQGEGRDAVYAAEVHEWVSALESGIGDEYFSEFGGTSDTPLSAWELIDLEEVTEAEFETVWSAARAQIIGRRNRP